MTSDKMSHTELRCSLLIEEGEQVAHHDEERPWEGGDNRFNLGSFLCHPLNFWSWPKRKEKRINVSKDWTIMTSLKCCSYSLSTPAAVKSCVRCINQSKFWHKEMLWQVFKLLRCHGSVDLLCLWWKIQVFMGSKQPAGRFTTLISCANCDSEFWFWKNRIGPTGITSRLWER